MSDNISTRILRIFPLKKCSLSNRHKIRKFYVCLPRQKPPMNYERPYSPVSHAPATAGTQLAPTRRYVRYAGTHCPHTYGVRVCSCAAIATEPCRPTACAGEHPNPSAYTTTAHYSLLTANSSYTFSAKGKDSETGLSYFGSRYYSSNLSIWLSVDPMSDKYPSLSPYVYCADNPVGLVDPNGDTVIVTGADADSYVQGLNTKNLTFSRDESGYVSYQGIAKTFLERRLVSAIKDPKIFVNICAENSTSIDNVGGSHR